VPQRRDDRIQWVRAGQGEAELGPNRATTGGSALSKTTWIGMAILTEPSDELATVPSPTVPRPRVTRGLKDRLSRG
jgi:hypothetical protein